MRIFESKWAGLPLLPLSGLYLLAWWVRLCLYRVGVRKEEPVDAFVISVGNLTVGGTGKTPFVIWLGNELLRRGLPLAVVSRGWMRRSRGQQVVSDGLRVLSSVYEAGDEPYLIAKRLPGAVVIADGNRVRGCRTAIREYGAEVVLLDDAFQHWSIRRDLDVVLVDSQRGFGNRFVVPAGPLREPLRALRRAHELVLTRWQRSGVQTKALKARVRSITNAPLTRFRLRTVGFVGFPKGIGANFPAAGESVVAVAGIAWPEQFFATLEGLGLHLARRVTFPDHHWYRPKDVAMIEEAARQAGARVIVTTEKDLVRLEPIVSESSLLWTALRVELVPVEEDEQHWEKLLDRIGQRVLRKS